MDHVREASGAPTKASTVLHPEGWPALRTAERATARGYIEAIVTTNSGVVIAGWMLLPAEELVRVDWSTSDGHAGTTAVLPRDDVAQSQPFHPIARSAGFLIRLPPIEPGTAPWLKVIGTGAGGGIGTLEQPISVVSPDRRFPPESLMRRVAHTTSADVFHATGLRTFSDFRRALHLVSPGSTIDRLLDWGCGCGRATSFLVEERTALAIDACDIDRDAITWLADACPLVQTEVTAPTPPTPYADGTFDAVVSHSVLTHLDRETQRAWIQELARITRSGAALVTTTHGEFAAQWSGVPADLLESSGIIDHTADETLDGVAPPGYYRSTFQSAVYTTELLTNWFEVVTICSGGAGNFQDLVIARRRAAA